LGTNSEKKMQFQKILKFKKKFIMTSNGKEYFISAEDFDQDILIGYLRLRFPSKETFREEITPDTALVRELHVYGPEVSIGKQADKIEFQHRGFGKQLLKRAEEICQENGKNKLLVLSGIGAKEYYRKQGYLDDGSYVGKRF